MRALKKGKEKKEAVLCEKFSLWNFLQKTKGPIYEW
jgi:hypothetical protein